MSNLGLPNKRMTDDHLEIRRLIENWAFWRDSGDWNSLATVWHPEGRMVTTWYKSSAADFVERSRRAWDEGVKVFHTVSGVNIEVENERAISQARMQIHQRAHVHGVLVDVVCIGRFWDAWEKRDSGWGLILRQPIYEADRMDVVDPAASLTLDADLLESFPEGYRHLAYLQSQIGFDVSKGLPGTRGPETDALQARGRRWLAGEESSCLAPSS